MWTEFDEKCLMPDSIKKLIVGFDILAKILKLK